MQLRERYINVQLFEDVDKIPLLPGYGRKSTIEYWHKTGLPLQIENGPVILQYAFKQSGGTEELEFASFPVYERMIPEFEEKVLQEKGDTGDKEKLRKTIDETFLTSTGKEIAEKIFLT